MNVIGTFNRCNHTRHSPEFMKELQRQGFVETCSNQLSYIPINIYGDDKIRTYNMQFQTAFATKIKSDDKKVTDARKNSVSKKQDKSYILRQPRAGDYGWVVQMHGELYAREYDWNEEFEGLCAGIVADFIKNFDAQKERCWIAEIDGERVGSVFLVKQSETVAKLRLLLVDPKARGLGLGKRLVDECTRFAKQAGYKKITLWTNSVLIAARNIYIQAGYKLVKEEPHHSFGHDLISQTWELEL